VTLGTRIFEQAHGAGFLATLQMQTRKLITECQMRWNLRHALFKGVLCFRHPTFARWIPINNSRAFTCFGWAASRALS